MHTAECWAESESRKGFQKGRHQHPDTLADKMNCWRCAVQPSLHPQLYTIFVKNLDLVNGE